MNITPKNNAGVLFSQKTLLGKFAFPIIVTLLFLFFAEAARAQESCELVGDVGIGFSQTENLYFEGEDSASVLPYLYFDWCRFTARLSTFAYKFYDFGYGSLELTTKLITVSPVGDSLKDLGIEERGFPVPLGLGTYQVTPYGLFVVNAVTDVTRSGSLIGEAYYGIGGQWQFLDLYLLLGEEYENEAFATSIYGINEDDTDKGLLEEHTVGDSWSGYVGLFSVLKPYGDYRVVVIVRRKFLSNEIKDSPIIDEDTDKVDTALVALTRYF